MKKRALVSVYNKEGIVEFVKKIANDYEIVSTGGTSHLLKEAGISVLEVADITGFEECLGGRVKTLHPAIQAGILAKESQFQEIEQRGYSPIELVVVNLYPFEKASQKEFKMEDLVEYIDIGGVTLLRAAAKNFERVSVLSSPEQYQEFLSADKNLEYRQKLALEAFKSTSVYDSCIVNALEKQESKTPEMINIGMCKEGELRYGENPHQSAALYKKGHVAGYQALWGKELSFNNLVDVDAAINVVSEFHDVAAVSIIKHNNPCGVAIGSDITDAYLKAFDCDPISAFGGIIAFSQIVTKEIAKHAGDVFLEVLVAPDYEPEALEILKKKKNLRIIKLESALKDYRTIKTQDIKELSLGTLVQSVDNKELDKDSFKVATKKKPTAEQVEDMLFAWKIAKHSKSNAIVVAKDKKTIGIGLGQTSRISAMEIALSQACERTKDAVIASDGFFPAVDNIQAAAQARIGAIIQPGGSIKDSDVISECDKYEISMITTGVRHFKH